MSSRNYQTKMNFTTWNSDDKTDFHYSKLENISTKTQLEAKIVFIKIRSVLRVFLAFIFSSNFPQTALKFTLIFLQ